MSEEKDLGVPSPAAGVTAPGEQPKVEIPEVTPETEQGRGGLAEPPEEPKKEESSSDWEKNNTDAPPKAPAKQEIPKVAPVTRPDMSPEEIAAAKKVAKAANKQGACNTCVYDKRLKHNVFQCDKYKDKRDCKYLLKYIEMTDEERAVYLKKIADGKKTKAIEDARKKTFVPLD